MPARARNTLLGLLALSLVLRLLGPIGRGLWFDEIWTLVSFGRLPLGKLLTSFGSDNNHPLYSVLSWFSMHALGESAFALRLPAVVFGVLSVGALYLYARRVTTEREAVIASVLLATSYHHVWFSQNARGYTLLLFFTITSTYFFEDLLNGSLAKAKRAVVPYAVALALGTYAHLTCIFVALAHFAVYAHVLFWKHERAARPAETRFWPLYGLLLAGVVSAALHAPLIPDMLAFFSKPGGGHAKPTGQWRTPWWTVAETARSLGFGLAPGLMLLGSALLVLAAGSLSYAKQSVPRWLLFVLPGAFGAFVMLALHRNLWPRFFFFQAAFLLLIIVRGLDALAKLLARMAPADVMQRAERGLFNAGLGVLALAWLVMLPRAYTVPKQDFEGAQSYVQSVRKPGEAVISTGLTMMPYASYYASDFVAVTSVPELEQALGDHGGYALSTLPTYLESRSPELFAALKQRGHEVKRFAGSVGDGDVVVLQLAPVKQGDSP